MLRVLCPAKINIGLSVLGKREDGYHDIASLFSAVSFFDALNIRPSDSYELSSNADWMPKGEENLITKALKALQEKSGQALFAEVIAEKNIPMGAGLGGGSSDCAGALVGLNEALRFGLPFHELQELALSLGSDVPFLLEGGLAACTGRGEVVLKRGAIPEDALAVLIVMPGLQLSTKEAYDSLDLRKGEEGGRIAATLAAFNALCVGNFTLLRALAINDFEPYAFEKHPELGEIKRALYKEGALYAAMSGTGSSIYGFFAASQALAYKSHFHGYPCTVCRLFESGVSLERS